MKLLIIVLLTPMIVAGQAKFKVVDSTYDTNFSKEVIEKLPFCDSIKCWHYSWSVHDWPHHHDAWGESEWSSWTMPTKADITNRLLQIGFVNKKDLKLLNINIREGDQHDWCPCQERKKAF